MPKETFFNLPDKKRNKIIKSSIEEFVDYSYDLASINRIVKKSNISKGSFYQYFKDKKDLFKYVIKKIVEKKMEYITPVSMNPLEHDFFTVIKDMYLAAIKFTKDNPSFVKIGNRFLSDKEHPLYKEIILENIDKSENIFKLLIERAIKREEIRDDIDIDFISYIISSLNIIVVEYYHENININFDEYIMKTVDKFLDFLKYGIKQNKKEVRND